MSTINAHVESAHGWPKAIVVVALALATSVAHASAQRTFVSSNGNDGNAASNCSLPFGCRSFLAAIGVTNIGGEIIVLDSAGYGPVTITKSVSIISPPGVYAGVSVITPGTDGIVINAAGIEVTLKGLTINGQGGNVGIRFMQGARLDIDGCTVGNMAQEGIRVEGPGTITIADTTVIGNTLGGINVNAAAVVTIVDSIVESNTGTGIAVRNGASATIGHTTVTRNTLRGISVHGVAAGTRVAVASSVVSDHTGGSGLYAEALGATLVARLDVAGTTIARNTNGVELTTSGGGAARAGVVSNQIVENSAAGILAAGSASSVVRASWNGIFRNATGFSATGGGLIHSPMTNYVRDNGVNGTPTADALL